MPTEEGPKLRKAVSSTLLPNPTGRKTIRAVSTLVACEMRSNPLGWLDRSQRVMAPTPISAEGSRNAGTLKGAMLIAAFLSLPATHGGLLIKAGRTVVEHLLSDYGRERCRIGR